MIPTVDQLREAGLRFSVQESPEGIGCSSFPATLREVVADLNAKHDVVVWACAHRDGRAEDPAPDMVTIYGSWGVVTREEAYRQVTERFGFPPDLVAEVMGDEALRKGLRP